MRESAGFKKSKQKKMSKDREKEASGQKMRYKIEMSGHKQATIATVQDYPRGLPPENAVEALREYARRHGWRVGNINVDAETRGKLTAECYMDEAGAHKGFCVAVAMD